MRILSRIRSAINARRARWRGQKAKYLHACRASTPRMRGGAACTGLAAAPMIRAMPVRTRDGPTGAENMAPDVVIFYAERCDLCHRAMDHFRERGIPFEAVEVAWKGEDWEDSPNARRMKALCGDVDFVPQILVRGYHIPGWRQLEPMIESGELERLIRDPAGPALALGRESPPQADP